MEKIEDVNDGVICIHFTPPRKTAFENGAINAHKDIWEVENMKKKNYFGSVNVFSPWLDLSMLINKVV